MSNRNKSTGLPKSRLMAVFGFSTRGTERSRVVAVYRHLVHSRQEIGRRPGELVRFAIGVRLGDHGVQLGDRLRGGEVILRLHARSGSVMRGSAGAKVKLPRLIFRLWPSTGVGIMSTKFEDVRRRLDEVGVGDAQGLAKFQERHLSVIRYCRARSRQQPDVTQHGKPGRQDIDDGRIGSRTFFTFSSTGLHESR